MTAGAFPRFCACRLLFAALYAKPQRIACTAGALPFLLLHRFRCGLSAGGRGLIRMKQIVCVDAASRGHIHSHVKPQIINIILSIARKLCKHQRGASMRRSGLVREAVIERARRNGGDVLIERADQIGVELGKLVSVRRRGGVIGAAGAGGIAARHAAKLDHPVAGAGLPADVFRRRIVIEIDEIGVERRFKAAVLQRRGIGAGAAIVLPDSVEADYRAVHGSGIRRPARCSR